KYPVPTRDAKDNAGLNVNGSGIYLFNAQAATVSVCGTAQIPTDCGIHTSNKLFAPSIGIAYRPTEKLVVRMGYAISPSQLNMGFPQTQPSPGEAQLDDLGVNPSPPAGSLTTGLPIIHPPVGHDGVFPLPPNPGNVTAVNTKTNYIRGYYQSYNFTVQ